MGVPGIKSRSVLCQASSLPIALSLWSPSSSSYPASWLCSGQKRTLIFRFGLSCVRVIISTTSGEFLKAARRRQWKQKSQNSLTTLEGCNASFRAAGPRLCPRPYLDTGCPEGRAAACQWGAAPLWEGVPEIQRGWLLSVGCGPPHPSSAQFHLGRENKGWAAESRGRPARSSSASSCL